MQCAVCHGSGLSAANAFSERVIECGGCQGTGWVDDDPVTLDEVVTLDDPVTLDELDTAAGTGTAGVLDWLLPGRGSGVDDLWLLQRLLDIDGRYLREMPNTMPGHAEPATAERLEAIVADYRRLGTLGRDTAHFDRASLDQKIANVLRSLGQTREALHDPDAAEEAYAEAFALYSHLGMTEEAEGVDRGLRALRLHRDRDVDTAVRDLRAGLDAATDPVDRAELVVELAEVHASRHDDLAAEELFLQAEQLLEPYRDRVSGAAAADALSATLAATMDGAASGPTPIESVMRVRGLLQRAYAGLTQVLREEHPDQAQRYLALRTQLEGTTAEGSAGNAAFSQRMSEQLEGLLGQFDRLVREDPDASS